MNVETTECGPIERLAAEREAERREIVAMAMAVVDDAVCEIVGEGR